MSLMLAIVLVSSLAVAVAAIGVAGLAGAARAPRHTSPSGPWAEAEPVDPETRGGGSPP